MNRRVLLGSRLLLGDVSEGRKGKWGVGTNRIMYGLLLPISQSPLWILLRSLATISASFLECSKGDMKYMLDPNPS